MANAFLGTPPVWVIDTPSATPITTDPTRIFRIKWDATAAGVAGDECKVTDVNGNVIFDDFALGANYTNPAFMLPTDKYEPFNGIVVPVLSHGKVFIYLR